MMMVDDYWEERECLLSDADSDTESEKESRIEDYLLWKRPDGSFSTDDEASEYGDTASLLSDVEDIFDDDNLTGQTSPHPVAPEPNPWRSLWTDGGAGDGTNIDITWTLNDNDNPDENEDDMDYVTEGCLSPRELYLGLDTRLCWVARCWELRQSREEALRTTRAALPKTQTVLSTTQAAPPTTPTSLTMAQAAHSVVQAGGDIPWTDSPRVAGDLSDATISTRTQPLQRRTKLTKILNFFGKIGKRQKKTDAGKTSCGGTGVQTLSQPRLDVLSSMEPKPVTEKAAADTECPQSEPKAGKCRKSLSKRIFGRILSCRNKWRGGEIAAQRLVDTTAALD